MRARLLSLALFGAASTLGVGAVGVGAAGVGLGAGALAAGCRGASLPNDATAPIRIGVVLPLSGSLAGKGAGYVNAVRVAVREINAAGGPLPGRRVELVVADSRTDADVGEREARRLLEEEGVVAILGDAGSASSLRIYQNVTGPAGVPQLSCSSTSSRLTDANAALPDDARTFFRTAPSDRLQGTVVADAARTDGACTRLGIFHLDDDYGTPFAEAISTSFTARGGMVTTSIGFLRDRPSYEAEAMEMAGTSPDCVAIVGYPVEAGRILRAWDMVPMAPSVVWIGTDGLFTSALVTEAGDPQLIDGMLGTAPLTTPSTPEFNAFSDRFSGIVGTAPEPFNSNCYDAAAVLMLAIAQAGTDAPDLVRDALRTLSDPAASSLVRPARLADGLAQVRDGASINYEGASGPVDFDPQGDVLSDYVIWQYSATTMAFRNVRTIDSSAL